METYEGTISYSSNENTSIAFIEIQFSQKYLLIISGFGSDGTSKYLVERGIINGTKVRVTGELDYHPDGGDNESNTLFFESNFIEES